MSEPIEITNGRESVKIYSVLSVGRQLYQSSYYQNGKRKRASFTSLVKAKQHARFTLGILSSENRQAEDLHPADLIGYAAAKKALSGVGISVPVAAEIFAKALSVLANGKPAMASMVLEACEFYRRHNPQDIQKLPLGELWEKFVDSRKRLGLSSVYISHCKIVMRSMLQNWKASSTEIPSAEEVAHWLEIRYTHPVTRNTALNPIKVFGSWLFKNKFMYENPFISIQKWKVKPTAPEIYTPQELRNVLEKCPKFIIPMIVSMGM
ncbi:MAG: hypothetical protein ACOYOK_16255 [Pseudobdellovibrionaceae bacterium]